MDETPNLGLPYIMAAQSQKHVTHNEAIRALDALVQLSVLDRSLGTPPDSPAEGARYIVAASPVGAWSGHAGHIAAYQDGAWMFYVPHEGWIAWIADEDVAVVWTGSAWSALTTGQGGGGDDGGGGEGDFSTLGINAAADTTNRLAVAAAATLFSHDGDDHRLKINKAAAGDTASLLYQTAFSGRAELGLAGDDDFHFKVSPDGSTWSEAIVIDKDTGVVTFPNTTLGGTGGVSGPVSSADGNIVLFDGTGGDAIKDSGKAISTDGTLAANSDAKLPTEKAVKTFVIAVRDALLAAAPGQLDTLDELAAALGDDANFAATMTAALAGKQAADSDLTAIAALSPSNNDVIQRKSGAWTNRTMAQLIADLAALGTTFQPLNSGLTAIAALTTTAAGRAILAYSDPNADRIIYWNDGAGAFASVTIGSGLSLSSGTLSATGGGGGRETLTANRTYYVRTDGSDSNDGLANTSGGAFLTLQKAVDVAAALDLSIYSVTIQVANGTYTTGVVCKSYVGAGPIAIVGNTTTPANCFIDVTGGNCFNAVAVLGKYTFRGFRLRTTTSGWTFICTKSVVDFGELAFDACAYGYQIAINSQSFVTAVANWSVTASASYHIVLSTQSYLDCRNRTVTLTGTPAFSGAFFAADSASACIAYGMTFSGSATGPRYSVQDSAVINTGGGGASYFPGDVAGSGSTPGTALYGRYL